jgi:seryl-tRNA synthetase
MHDIKAIRKDPDAFDQAMIRRGLGAVSDEILQRDQEVRGAISSLQDLQQQANSWAKKIGELKARGEDASEAIAKSKELKVQIATLKDQKDKGDEEPANEAVDELLMTLPNTLDEDVPEGADETDNEEVRRWGEAALPTTFHAKEHFELGESLGLMDFEQSAKISGSRFVTLKGALCRMERALMSFMVDVHTKEHGYTEVSPPLLVRDEAMFGSGQLPKFDEDSFATTNGYRLIPTAEVPLVNLVRESILSEEELPLRFVAATPCFRSEAGSAGRDTKGMIRLHQFWKVELVSVTDERSAADELERKTKCAEEILKRLELPYRVVKLCTGDTGFCAHKTYDLEVWLPGQDKYREISSCSNDGAFQARRMSARYRDADQKVQHVHTQNGSGVAVGRAMVAIMENYQNEDGSITVPEVLREYMGCDVIK